ncbi:MAG: L,D-transpeptidase [Polyangiaceae bacterium]
MEKDKYLGYVRPGSSIALRSEERIKGEGCAGGFYQVEPRGYVCADRTVTETPPEPFWSAATATHGRPGPMPYSYAFSDGTPMYNRVPTEREIELHEKWLPKGKVPKTLGYHEELAVAETIPAVDPMPEFFANGASPRTQPFDVVEQVMPIGSMLSYTTAFEANGRTWLLSTDHTIVPADRVRPFRISKFHGVDLRKDAALPIAFMRVTDKPQFVRGADGSFTANGGHWPVRSWVGLTGKTESTTHTGPKGRTIETLYRETRELDGGGAPLWISDADATVVDVETERPSSVKEGQKFLMIHLESGTLVAYEDMTPVYATLVSPGRGGLPQKGRDNVENATTPIGSFTIVFKDRAATMSSETGKNRSFWIQDVPHTQYFDPPFALHAAFWHERFGEFVSAGCVNLSPLDAEILFHWTDPPIPDDWQGVSGVSASENGPTTIVVLRR